MEFIFEGNMRTRTKLVQGLAGGVLAVSESRRDVDMPMGEGAVERVDPFADAGFAGIDLLSATNKTDDHGPIGMAIHAGDQELGLGVREVWRLLLPQHEVGRLLLVPGALGLIEEGNVFDRRAMRVGEAFIAEVVDVLDEHLHFTHGCALLEFLSEGAFAVDTVAGEGFAEDGDEWAVAREEDAIEIACLVDVLCGDVEADERLACAGNAGDEADGFLMLGARAFDDGGDGLRRESEVGGAGVAAGDVGDGMAAIEGHGSFDDCGSGAIAALLPGSGVDVRSGSKGEDVGEDAGQHLHTALDRQEEIVVVGRHLEQERHRGRGSGDKDRSDDARVTGFVEVLEVEGVVADLVEGVSGELFLAYFELEDEDDAVYEEEDIDTFTKAGD